MNSAADDPGDSAASDEVAALLGRYSNESVWRRKRWPLFAAVAVAVVIASGLLALAGEAEFGLGLLLVSVVIVVRLETVRTARANAEKRRT